jgi:hypothetical protein
MALLPARAGPDHPYDFLRIPPGAVHGEPGTEFLMALSRTVHQPLLTVNRPLVSLALAMHARETGPRER